MTYIEAIYDALHPTMESLLIGGLHYLDQHGNVAREISRQDTPDAFDANREIQPCALLKATTETPVSPRVAPRLTTRLSFAIWFYQRRGTDDIEAARKVAYSLLYLAQICNDDTGCFAIEPDNTTFAKDDILDANVIIQRWQALIIQQ
jgi:hypothetical protein